MSVEKGRAGCNKNIKGKRELIWGQIISQWGRKKEG